jgi:hypothetical protein
VKGEFLIERSGKTFVLYQGLLDAAHSAGLKEIDTALLQVPTQENNNVAIAKAIVLLEDVDDMSPTKELREKSFSGLGDASPENVGKNIAPHIIRMAETRAKARALRDALNIGATALEELGDVPDQSPAPPPVASGGGGQGGGDRRPQNIGQPTEKQLSFLRALIDDQPGDDPMARFEAKVGKKFNELSRGEVSEWIEKLK